MNHNLKTQIIQRHLNLLQNRYLWTEAHKRTSKSNRSNANPRLSVDNKRRVQTNYDILGISPKASHKEIKSAYYSLSKSCHPDVNQSSEAATQFREITAAYDVLSNQDSKKAYDSAIGNHRYEPRIFDNSEINQQNLDRYRDFGRFREKKFSDDEEFLRQKWKKRRNLNMEQKYKDMTEEENKKRYRYRDPLNYDPKTYYTEHFGDETAKKFGEEIDKQGEKFAKELHEWRSDIDLKIPVLILLFIIPLALHLLEEMPIKTEETKSKLVNKNDTKTN